MSTASPEQTPDEKAEPQNVPNAQDADGDGQPDEIDTTTADEEGDD